jgi:hypothetical protein
MRRKKAARPKVDTTKGNKDQPARAFKRALEAVKAMRVMAPLLEQELRQYVTLQEKIKSAFGGNPFLPDEPPTSAVNMRRFRAYIGMRKSATMMIVKVTNELMRAHGVDPNHPHDMWELPWFAGAVGVSGAPAGVSPQQRPDGQAIPWEPPPGQYPPEGLRLARHLHVGAHRIKKPSDANSAVKASNSTGKGRTTAKIR